MPSAPAHSVRSPFDSYLSDIHQTALLTRAEEHDLSARVAGGDGPARDRLARANLRLVVCIARQYAGRGLAVEDLIAEGNVGLLRAVEGFDPAAGTRFATYASYWVKQSIQVALNKHGHSVRIPQYMGVLVSRWRRAESTLRDVLGRNPLTDEVATDLGLSPRQAKAVVKALTAVSSARAGGADEGDSEPDLEDARAAQPGDRLAAADDVREAIGALDRLNERESAVIRLRFGLDGGEPLTLEAVGQRFGLTRERARQIERDALATLRECLSA